MSKLKKQIRKKKRPKFGMLSKVEAGKQAQAERDANKAAAKALAEAKMKK